MAAGDAGALRKPPGRLPRGLLVAVAFVLLYLGLRTTPVIRDLPGRPPAWTMDIDAGLIREGLGLAPTFPETLKWWTGTWAGQVPYYRPLTSYLFWLEWKTWGEEDWRWVWVALAAHAAAAALFVGFVFRFAQRSRVPWPALAAGAAGLWYCGFMLPYREGVADQVSRMWKNQPDSFAAICVFASLHCYLSAQEGRRTLPAAMVLYLAACGFKEIAVPLPLVCVALEGGALWSAEKRSSWMRIILMGAVGVAFLVVRAASIGTVGYLFGSNHAWLPRTLGELTGPLHYTVSLGVWLANACGVWLFLVGFTALRLRGKARPGVLTASAGAAALTGCALIGSVSAYGQEGGSWLRVLTPLELLHGLMIPMTWHSLTVMAATVIQLATVALLWPKHRGCLVMGLIWTAAFLAPLTLSPGPSHRYYLPQAGYLLTTGCFLGVVAPPLVHALRTVAGRLRGPQPAAEGK